MLGDKLRFRFAKAGTLRLLSHHDLMRCLERMLRRADVPFKLTAGFHPGPRFVFALSLPLGVVGRDEVVEIELTRPCDSEDVLRHLNSQAPIGLNFTRVSIVPMKATAIPRRVVYEFPLPSERAEEVAHRAAELLAESRVWVDRLRPSPKRLNIRPYLRSLSVVRTAAEQGTMEPFTLPQGHTLTLDLWVTQTGTARAEEILRLLGVSDVLEAGAVLERTLVEVRDELTDPHPTDNPPDGPADALPLDMTTIAAMTRQEDEPNQPAAAHWGASPSGPVVE